MKSGFPSLLLLVISTVLLLRFARAYKVHYYDFVLTETDFTMLCETTTVMAVNQSVPGPEIRVQKGDLLYVNFYNEAYYPITIHWHGVKQPRNPWFDGPEYITQCPIHQGTNFTYKVIFSDEEGTLWWHAHSDWARFSVFGPIIILPADGTTFPFAMPDGEQTIMLGAWYTGSVMEEVKESLIEGIDAPKSDGYTINGLPGDFSACSNSETTLRMHVEHGKTYLLRIVNAILNAPMFFAIAEHNLTIVGSDGAYTKPFTTSYIMISPGQTMDALIVANQTLGYYYMAARNFDTFPIIVWDFDHENVTAIIEYSGNYTTPPTPIFPYNLPIYQDFEAAKAIAYSLRSLTPPEDLPINITTRMYITTAMNEVKCASDLCAGVNGTKMKSSLNNMSFVYPTTDILTAYFWNMSGFFETDFPDIPPVLFNFTGDFLPDNQTYAAQGTKVKVVNHMEAVEMVFQDTSQGGASELHPMHLHGHSFYFVGTGLGNFNVSSDPLSYNLVDPPEINTVSIPKLGWSAIRFIANNPGVWFIHCHLDRHMSWGMNTVLIVKNGDTPESSILPPPDYMPTCNASAVNFLRNFDDSVGAIEEISKQVSSK